MTAVALDLNEDQQARSAAYDRAVSEDGELREGLAHLTELLKQGKVSLAGIGGFGEAELQGGYRAAVAMLESDMPAKGLKILGTLMTLNPRVGKFYRLAGIALHRLKQYALADAYYDVALAYLPDDAIALLYRGEVKLLAGQAAEGRRLLQAGLAAAADQPALHAIAQRARAVAQSLGVTLNT